MDVGPGADVGAGAELRGSCGVRRPWDTASTAVGMSLGGDGEGDGSLQPARSRLATGKITASSQKGIHLAPPACFMVGFFLGREQGHQLLSQQGQGFLQTRLVLRTVRPQAGSGRVG